MQNTKAQQNKAARLKQLNAQLALAVSEVNEYAGYFNTMQLPYQRDTMFTCLQEAESKVAAIKKQIASL